MAFTPKVNKEQAIAMIKGGMKPAQVARTFGVSSAAVANMIARAKERAPILQEYRENKDKIMEDIQAELLSAVSADNVKEAQSLVTAAAILDDKIRLERGQATSHTIVDLRALLAIVPDAPLHIVGES